MTEYWQKLAARFDALALRERVLIVAAAILGTILVFHAVALEPLVAQKKRITRQLADTSQSLKAVTDVLKIQQGLSDPEAVRRSYRDALRKQLAGIDQDMQGLQRGVVPPERMAELLEEVLARSRGLHLVSLHTLPVQRFERPGAAPLAADKAGKPAPQESARTVYEHGFEITLQGSYADLHDYLARLEKLPWQMFWGRIQVNTEQFPRLRVTLIVQTLSLSKAWLIV
jgi:MSHA biogenesis protein MshJ